MVKLYLLMAPFVALVGGVFLAVAIRGTLASKKRRGRATVRADAKVVEKKVATGRIGQRPLPCCVYEFPVNGVLRRGKYAGSRHTRVGDTVTILYDPDFPETIWVPSCQPRSGRFALYFIGGCWSLMGVMLFIYGILGIK